MPRKLRVRLLVTAAQKSGRISRLLEAGLKASSRDPRSLPPPLYYDIVCATTHHPQYCYEQLPAEDSIRLLMLKPAASVYDPLLCSMTTTSLSEPQAYTALSYSWAMQDGDASFCRSLTIDGKQLAITRNLFEGLLRIRKASETLTLWVDAVCINQDDRTERSSQVSRMAEIYRSAEMVMSWLGEGDDPDGDQHAAAILGRLPPDRGLSQHEDIYRAVLHGSTKGWCQGETGHNHVSCDVLPIEPIVDDDSISQQFTHNESMRSSASAALPAMYQFFARRYWRRRWIVQEIFHARRISWAWGTQLLVDINVPWGLKYVPRRLQNALRLLGESLTAATNLFELNLDIVNALFELREDYWTPSEKKIMTALQKFESLECADPRDRLYSLLGLSVDQNLVVPDYSLSMDEVNCEFAGALIRHNLGSVLLEHFESERQSSSQQLLPSWVPDLRKEFQCFVKWGETFTGETFTATLIRDGRSLEATIYRFGVFGNDFALDKKKLSFHWQDGTQLRFHQLSYQVDFEDGDLVCSTSAGLSRTFILILRPSDTDHGTVYRLLYTNSRYDLKDANGKFLSDEVEEKMILPESSKETIIIV